MESKQALREPGREYPSLGHNIAYETFFTGAIGGSIVALLFLILDSIAGQPLFTPSVAGGAIFFGVAPERHGLPSLEAVALFTPLHFLLAAGGGLAAALLVRAVEPRRNRPVLATLLLFVFMEAGFLVGAALIHPGMAEVLGYVRVAGVNLIAAAGMIAWVHHSGRVEDEAREESEHREAVRPTRETV